jgi:hypothetical protein
MLYGAESKDPEDAYLACAVRSFSTTEARTGPTRHGLSLGREQERLAAGKEAQPHSHHQSRFKDLVQTWGWKMITVHEKMHP